MLVGANICLALPHYTQSHPKTVQNTINTAHDEESATLLEIWREKSSFLKTHVDTRVKRLFGLSITNRYQKTSCVKNMMRKMFKHFFGENHVTDVSFFCGDVRWYDQKCFKKYVDTVSIAACCASRRTGVQIYAQSVRFWLATVIMTKLVCWLLCYL